MDEVIKDYHLLMQHHQNKTKQKKNNNMKYDSCEQSNAYDYWTVYFTENYHGSNTGFLVAVLVSVVSGVFITFALVALCYRSVVVHKNIALCLRLVYNKKKPIDN